MPLWTAAPVAASAAGGASGGAFSGLGTMAVGSGIIGGTSLLGGMMGSSSARAMANADWLRQKEVMQNAMQWRAEDAKKAGLHPLAALGAMLPGPTTTIPITDPMGPAVAEMGQNIGNIVARAQPNWDRQRHEMDMALGAANLAESDARRQMYLSQAAQARQSSFSGLGVQADPELAGQVPFSGGIVNDIVNVKPPDVEVAKRDWPSIISGTHPSMQVSRILGDIPLIHFKLQGESLPEMMESMSISEHLRMLAQNTRIFGPEWLNDYMGTFSGKKPSRRYDLTVADPEREITYPGTRIPDLMTQGMKDALTREFKKYKDVPRRFKKKWKDYFNKP